MKTQQNAAALTNVDDTATGQEDWRSIEPRRRALGYRTFEELAEASGIYRATISRAESGNASHNTVRSLLAFLDSEEAKREQPAEPAPEKGGGPIRVQLHDVFGIGDVDVTFDGNTPPEVMESYVRALIAGVKPPTREGEPE